MAGLRAGVAGEDGLWQVDAPDESVGIFGWGIYHQASEDCETTVLEADDWAVKAICSCGATLEEGREPGE